MDKFYSLVTDLYEWGWGQSFHFSRRLPNRDWAASEVAHEAWAAATIQLGPGKTALDVGCGVGGPMRTVAAVRCAAPGASGVPQPPSCAARLDVEQQQLLLALLPTLRSPPARSCPPALPPLLPPPAPPRSGGNVVGITINEYQVQRATHHNQRQVRWAG